MKLKVLDLFSGIGGFSLGLERTGGFETVAFCEIEPFCQKVLKKHWPKVPIFEDVRTLDYEGSVDVISGGFPCQPFSVAGKQKGAEDDRHLWPAMFDLVKKYRPDWVIGENVTGLIPLGLDSVLTDLEGEEYTVRTFIIPAVAVDAKHKRDRVWIMAHSNSSNQRSRLRYGQSKGSSTRKCSSNCGAVGTKRAVGNAKVMQCDGGGDNAASIDGQIPKPGGASGEDIMADTEGVYAQGQQNRSGKEQSRGGCRWEPEPAVGRVADGVSGRVDRLKALGNAVVPQIPEIIGDAILQSIKENGS